MALGSFLIEDLNVRLGSSPAGGLQGIWPTAPHSIPAAQIRISVSPG